MNSIDIKVNLCQHLKNIYDFIWSKVHTEKPTCINQLEYSLMILILGRFINHGHSNPYLLDIVCLDCNIPMEESMLYGIVLGQILTLIPARGI